MTPCQRDSRNIAYPAICCAVNFQHCLSHFSWSMNSNFHCWCVAWLELPSVRIIKKPGYYKLATLIQLSLPLLCLYILGRASIHLNKDILIRKIPQSVAPPAPKLNKVTLCWTLCWLSLFIFLMNSILEKACQPTYCSAEKSATLHLQKLYSAKRWNRDPYKVQFSERWKITT